MRRSPGSGVSRPCLGAWLSLALCSVGLLPGAHAELPDPGVRPPAVAGRFYPDDPAKLEAAVRGYRSDAVKPDGPRPVAMVVPHAGYIFSGQIAADAYRQAVDHDYDLIVILGTNHTTRSFRGVSVYPGSGYRTPLGVAPVDRDLATALIDASPAVTFRPDVHQREHSIEVQVPFLQVLFPEVKILPAVVGSPDAGLCASFGKALARHVAARRPLILASSDLSHYPGYKDAVEADRTTLEAVTSLDPQNLRATVARLLREGRPGLSTCACGLAPTLAAMEAARALGATGGRVVSYANSGDTPVGNRSEVVGYGAVVFTAGTEGGGNSFLERPDPPTDLPLGSAEKNALLGFARASIARFLRTGTAPLARGLPTALDRRQGAFVTLETDGKLRGCVGHKNPDLPLGQVVGAMALQAAFNDGRFPPLGSDELEKIRIKVSLLSPLQEVAGPEAIVPGRDGVCLEKRDKTAVYLPEVATENGWSRRELLDHLCVKAGLSRSCWRTDARLQTFRTEILREPDELHP